MAACDKIVLKDSVNPSSEIIDKVLGLELLREMILDFAIHDEKEKKAIANIRACRLVCKIWLQSTTRVFLKRQEPMFRFRFFWREKLSGMSLDEFVNVVSGRSLLDIRISPFSISGSTELLLERHRQSLQNCIVHCASGLVQLDLQLAQVEPPFTLDADLSLPKLGRFRVNGDIGNCEHRMGVIQAVLNVSPQLKFFELSDYSERTCPQKAFKLPPSLTELKLSCKLDDQNLETLGKHLACVLKNLHLDLQEPPLKNGLITSILEKVRKSLKSFYIHCWSGGRDSRNRPTTFQLPLMEKLERLEINTEYLELRETFSSLEKLVPVLKHMSLSHQTVSAFRKWTERSCFSSVTFLETSLKSLQLYDGLTPACINFDECLLQSLKRAFPNLRQLSITICGVDRTVLTFIMKEMSSLQELRINGVAIHSRTDETDVPDPKSWDALFLGIPLESVAVLNESPELWDDLPDKGTVSIRNLTGLQTFSLFWNDEFEYFFLSSAVFQHAFFKMPNLTKLVLDQPFYLSKEMKMAWREQGRIVNRVGPVVDEDSEPEEEED